jgi:ABC-type transport system involved in cytochrome c biogenesis permease subunit
MANLTLALLSVFFLFRRRIYNIFAVLMTLSFAALTSCLLLRWIISGTIPMNNGYETTLVMAWLILLVALLLFRRLRIMVTFGLLTSGFMLLVSHIGQMNPAITHRMPVLNSPLLSIHVSIIMMAYALLSLTFITSITYFLTFKIKRLKDLPTHLTWLNGIFLYPAMTFLGIGIFVGAIWANVSWGTYWGWDPKEVWALITFMVYAAVLHQDSLPLFKNPLWYHLYIAIAFFTVIMTYFGVNYFLGGMHSYA